jgi:hypothetical protein
MGSDFFSADCGFVEGVHGEAGEEFGVEVGGLLGHDFEVEADVFHLLEGDRLDEEGNVGVAAADLSESVVGFAEVADVVAGADGFFVEAEQFFEDDFVELDDVEFTLARGKGFKQRADGFGPGGEQVVTVAGCGDEGDAGGGGELFEQGGCALKVSGGGGGDFLDGEKLGGVGGKLAAVEADEAEDDAVGGQDGNARGFHVDEGHHHGGFREGGRGETCRAGAGLE